MEKMVEVRDDVVIHEGMAVRIRAVAGRVLRHPGSVTKIV